VTLSSFECISKRFDISIQEFIIHSAVKILSTTLLTDPAYIAAVTPGDNQELNTIGILVGQRYGIKNGTNVRSRIS